MLHILTCVNSAARHLSTHTAYKEQLHFPCDRLTVRAFQATLTTYRLGLFASHKVGIAGNRSYIACADQICPILSVLLSVRGKQTRRGNRGGFGGTDGEQ